MVDKPEEVILDKAIVIALEVANRQPVSMGANLEEKGAARAAFEIVTRLKQLKNT